MFAPPGPNALVVGAVVAKLPIAVVPPALDVAAVEDRAGVLATGRQGQPVSERVHVCGVLGEVGKGGDSRVKASIRGLRVGEARMPIRVVGIPRRYCTRQRL